jgi:hypothetical protein
MATAYRYVISDESLPVQPPRRELSLASSIAASRFDSVDDLILLGDEHQAAPEPEPELSERSLFRVNYLRWLDDSEFDSLPGAMREHESYQAIVDRGERVLPLIAAELRREPSFIFLALEDITGENPVPEVALGNLQATTDAWLAWLQS